MWLEDLDRICWNFPNTPPWLWPIWRLEEKNKKEAK
jgi:hypothetical protein